MVPTNTHMHSHTHIARKNFHRLRKKEKISLGVYRISFLLSAVWTFPTFDEFTSPLIVVLPLFGGQARLLIQKISCAPSTHFRGPQRWLREKIFPFFDFSMTNSNGTFTLSFFFFSSLGESFSLLFSLLSFFSFGVSFCCFSFDNRSEINFLRLLLTFSLHFEVPCFLALLAGENFFLPFFTLKFSSSLRGGKFDRKVARKQFS